MNFSNFGNFHNILNSTQLTQYSRYSSWEFWCLWCLREFYVFSDSKGWWKLNFGNFRIFRNFSVGQSCFLLTEDFLSALNFMNFSNFGNFRCILNSTQFRQYSRSSSWEFWCFWCLREFYVFFQAPKVNGSWILVISGFSATFRLDNLVSNIVEYQ